MSTGGILGAIGGGIIGFFIGGPTGAFMGASIGFSLGMMIDPLTPDVKSPGMAVEPLQVTSNVIGTPIADLLGTSRITGFLLGYGLERAEPQYTKVQGSKGGKKAPKQLTGYKHYASWQLGICFGPADMLYAVYKNDNDAIWAGELARPASGGVETVVIGGVGTMRFYFGTDDQPADATVATLIGDATLNSPLKGLCYVVFDDCYIGTYNRLPTMSFVIRRTPTIAFSDKHQVEIYDYNPMHAMWYWLVTLAGLPAAWLHSVDFAAVALTLYNEGRGITALLNQQGSLETYIETANAHIDGILRYGCDATFHPKLIRDDYTPANLETIDEKMLLEKPEFSRGSWIDTVNEVKAQYSELHRPVEVGPLTIQPSIMDTMLWHDVPDMNFGNYGYFYVRVGGTGWRRPIFRFDFNSLPANAVITSASLGLYYYANYGNPPVGRIYWVYELTEPDWTEMGATWNKYDGANAWAVPGGDYITTRGASVVFPAVPQVWVNWDVSDLVRHFQSVHGCIADFLLKDGNETSVTAYGATFYTREFSTPPDRRPRLVLNYYLADMPNAMNIKQSITDPPAIDPGNMDIQGRTVSKTIRLGMFSTNENASWGANNQLRKESYPFGGLKISVNRKAFRHEVGDCFKLNYSPYSIAGMVCRVLGKNEEAIESEKITITAMEDVFSVGSVTEIYTVPTDHSILRPAYEVDPFVHQRIIETPYAMVGGKVALLPMACRESDQDLGFEVYVSIDGGASYYYVDTIANIRPYGTLTVAYSDQTYNIDETTGITVDFHNNDVDQFETTTWPEVLSGQKNTAFIFQAGGAYEIISFKDITPVAGLQYKLDNIIRGRFGTEKLSHLVGEDLYVVDLNSSVIENEEILAGVTRKFKFVPYNLKQVGDISDCTALTLAITGVALTPYKPINFHANGSSLAARYDTDVVLSWSPRYRGKGAGIGAPGIVLAESTVEGFFSIEVWVGGVNVRSSNGISVATWTYTEAMNLADNGGLAETILFKISNYQSEGGIVYESDQAEVTCKKNAGGMS